MTDVDFAVFEGGLTDLLAAAPLPDLGPGTPATALKSKISGVVHDLFPPARVKDAAMARAAEAGLWLYFNFHDESHNISQDLPSPTASYWHGILHRREPDPGNAKYWFRRVGQHPIFPKLHEAATDLAKASASAANVVHQRPTWDPMAFVDTCEAQRGRGTPGEELCRQIQKTESDLLMEFCLRRALGKE